MDIYTRKSRWKLYLALAGLAVLLGSLIYSNFLAGELAQGELNKARVLAQAYQSMQTKNLDESIDLEAEIITSNQDVPIIVVDRNDAISWARNFGEENDQDSTYLANQLVWMKNKGPEPIQEMLSGQTIYYKNTRTLTLLTYFPLFQLLLLAAFILVGYMGFSSARKAEQNRVWVGMAKETAHQLGTPISGIVGWIEHLKESLQGDDVNQEVVSELRNDVEKLELIADRFSKIGSAPKLEKVDVIRELEKNRKYMARRASRRIVFDFPDPDQSSVMTHINPPLFNWVVENLLRNALDAMEGEGKITAEVSSDDHFVQIDISDTGAGIQPSKLKTVFQPGYTTKKRGWGLGLSLARRIIENYHKGKIFVKSSKPGEGTTFTIKLPA